MNFRSKSTNYAMKYATSLSNEHIGRLFFWNVCLRVAFVFSFCIFATQFFSLGFIAPSASQIEFDALVSPLTFALSKILRHAFFRRFHSFGFNFLCHQQMSFQYGDKQCARIRCVFLKPWGNYQLLLMGVSTSKEPKCKQMIRNNDDEMPETHRQWLNINYVCTILVTCPFYVNILQA